MTRTKIAIATAGFGLVGAVALFAQTTAQLAQSASMPQGVPIVIKDRSGKVLTEASLPKDTQAQLARVKKLANGPDAMGMKITVGCTYPPLSCTITLSF